MPNGLLIGGEAYPISTDFRTAVAYQMMAVDGSLTAEGFCHLWFPERRPEDLEAAMEAVGCFYNMGAEPEEKAAQEKAQIPYDFWTDGPVIFAAFQRHYGMDLSRERLHWWQFRALLEALVTHSFRQRVAYRVGDLQGLSAQERAQALKYRRIYAIGPERESLSQHLGRLDEILRRRQGQEGL